VRILGGDEQAKKFLADPAAVTRALRDYVWSIGINGGTGPAGPAAAEPAQGNPEKPGAPRDIRRAAASGRSTTGGSP
jgi:hypothetical protein